MKIRIGFFFLLLCASHLSAMDADSHIKSFETPVVKYLKPLEISDQNSGIDLIDCIYVINLDSRPGKWKGIKKQLDDRGLKYNRVSAVNGWEISYEQLKELCGPYPIRLKKGEYGCILSHLSVLNDAYKRGFKHIWVLEDDAEFLEEIAQIPHLLKKLSKIDSKWDVFYTDGSPRYLREGKIVPGVPLAHDPRPDENLPPLEHFIKNNPVSKEIIKIGQRNGTTSMILTRNGIKKILDYFTHVYMWSPIDINMHYIHGIREYVSTKDIVSNRINDDSDTLKNVQTQAGNLKTNQNAPKEDQWEYNFALAQSLKEEKHYFMAIEAYKKRIAVGDKAEEVFWSQYQIGSCQEALGMDPEVFTDTYYKAIQINPQRAEPYHALARHYRKTKNSLLGYLIAKEAMSLSTPKGVYFVDTDIYQYGIFMEYFLNAYQLGHYIECKKASDKILTNKKLPPNIRECVLNNMKWVYGKLTPQMQKDTSPTLQGKQYEVSNTDEHSWSGKMRNFLKTLKLKHS